jgi:protein-disulfide isomerase
MMQPLDEAVDHVRGPVTGHVIVEYGDFECPYSRKAFREIERARGQLSEDLGYVFRHFPLTEIHPHALAAAAAAEAASQQLRYWDMHELLFHRQHALEEDDLREYAGELGLEIATFEHDRVSPQVLQRVRPTWRAASLPARCWERLLFS